MASKLKSIWRAIRTLSGDDAYERYLAHYAEQHKPDSLDQDGFLEPPLNKQEYFKQWQDNKWKGVKRCC